MASQNETSADPKSIANVQKHDLIGNRGLAGLDKGTTERIFPIRIQHPNRRSAPRAKTDPIAQRSTSNIRPNIPLSKSEPALALPSVSTVQVSKEELSLGQRFITNRFDYLPPNDKDVTTASSSGQKIYRCEDEPIHIPGAIQHFGALIAIREEGNVFLVRVVSENAQSVTGLEPSSLFELRCFTDLLNEADRKELLIRIHTLPAGELKNSGSNPDVFSISLTSHLGAPISLYCAMHLEFESGFIICEFERERNTINPTNPPDSGLPDQPWRIINHEATEHERLLSTTSKSKPLHTLQVARANSRQLCLMDLFQIQSEIQTQLLESTDLPVLLDTIVGLVHDLTGFHRVMVYQFDETAAGSVVSEIIDPRASADLYRGLHFPASDIPKQARELYIINRIRVLYDRTKDTARLLCRTFDDAKVPLNLQHSYLRAMSPVHLRYLANMGVQASMSISLIVNQKLWGLIVCHNYGPAAGMQIPLPMREVCKSLGNLASSNVEKLLLSSRILVWRPLSNAHSKQSPFAYITSSASDLLHMLRADFGFLVIGSEARTIGELCAYSESVALLQFIAQQAFTSIFYTKAIQQDCPDFNFPPGLTTISGMLVIPLAASSTDFLVFFRKGESKEITWAGNPNEKLVSHGTSYLEPRSSFQRWSQNIVGTSREWTEGEVESATVLATLYRRFIEVWRQEEAVVKQT